MNDKARQANRKFQLQSLAFLLIMLPPIGLYYTVAAGLVWATWLLMALIVAGMFLAILVT